MLLTSVQCLLLPSEVVPEDIISIKGQQVEIASKQSTAPVSSTGFPLQESNKQWIDVKQDRVASVMFLDSWEVKETEKEKKVYITLLKTGSLDNAIQEFSLEPSWFMSHYITILKCIIFF